MATSKDDMLYKMTINHWSCCIFLTNPYPWLAIESNSKVFQGFPRTQRNGHDHNGIQYPWRRTNSGQNMIKMITALGTSWKHRLFLLLLLPFYLTYTLAFILTFILIFYLASILTFYLAFYFLVSVRVPAWLHPLRFLASNPIPGAVTTIQLGPVLWILQQRRWPRFFSPPGSYLRVHTVHGSVLRERRISHRPQNWCLGKTPPPQKKGKVGFFEWMLTIMSFW